MIFEALTFLTGQVNRYLDSQLGATGSDRVTLGNIARFTDSDGSSGGPATSGMAMLTLVNVEEDKVARNPENFRRIDDTVVYRNPAIHLNLYIVFSAFANDYPTALRIIAFIVQCFQAHRAFEGANYPDLNPGIEKLTVNLFTLNFEQINHLWSTLGGKYWPSVLYKVRMITIEDTTNYATGAPTRELDLAEGMAPA